VSTTRFRLCANLVSSGGLKDPFKTQKMKAVRLVDDLGPASDPHGVPIAGQSSQRLPPSSLPSSLPSSARFPPSSDPSWTTEGDMTERTTEPELVAAVPRLKDRATLTVITGFNAGQVFALDGTSYVMGRGTEAQIWIEDASVSREHARISCANDGSFVLEDLGSTNGTFVAGQRVTVQRLSNGDGIQLGTTLLLRFAITDDAEEELQRRLYESSTRDALTRAYNRKYLVERLGAEVAHSLRHRVKLSILMIDVDEFKRLNDVYGHLVGDMVLRIVAAQISRVIRVEDVFARYGGEEFVILARSTGRLEACQLADRIRESIASLRVPVDGAADLQVTVSVGVATLAEAGEHATPTSLLDLADKRMYRAKMAGRNKVCAEGGIHA
jgi:diguanylate cyclase (GGDEF)-like protein